ncbi:MAG: multifunctional CCA addition/repair protein [Burkholderia sp.]|nr:multifunctional CCA addition/repair protein [Burkholderia sp.]
MKIYAVGGAIRDKLLGIPVKDVDYVVVGSTPEQLVKQGFKPVGKDFPVFLHPITSEEYALARTEYKTTAGYHGFQFRYAPDVTLNEDLARRDLTINAMAREINQDGEFIGPIIDPFGGQSDLRQKVFRHVSKAFIEDPVRILRIARFAARFPDFIVIEETITLMHQMVINGEVDSLVAERVWQEISLALMEIQPSRMLVVLRECGALVRILPEIESLFGIPQLEYFHPEIDTGVHIMMAIDYAAKHKYSLAVRFAVLTHDIGKATTPSSNLIPYHIGHEMRGVDLLKSLCKRFRVPKKYQNIALIVMVEHNNIHQVMKMQAFSLVQLLERIDALRRPERFYEILQACESDARGRLRFEHHPYAQADLLRIALVAMRRVDTRKIAGLLRSTPNKIREAIHKVMVSEVTLTIKKANR